ncbi:hypothetical protein UFOVP435_76 [uncultured Caudovirales phage]|uniref:Uncharacterized protein n=1 Tax=uncultured Caudovirales phage TaxID=2100421 RepID=A0A6J5MDZ7_9CAUD|nr:hypothetical protein UFOVP435_76 [uncultured Caudovirales phage]
MTKKIRIARIASLNGSMADPATSHRAAWAWIRARQLEEQGVFDAVVLGEKDLPAKGHVTDVIYYWGMEWSGALNLFGGATKKNGDRLRLILDHKEAGLRQWCLDIPMPDIGYLAGKRPASEVGWECLHPKADWHAVSEVCKHIPSLAQQPDHGQRVVIGDSHAMSLWAANSYISRNDHKTLHGVLNPVGLDLANILKGWHVAERDVWLYFGNIDIRHHLMRLPDPAESTRLLVREYVRQAEDLMKFRGAATITLVEALPIPLDSRRIPKSGFYKGTPFYGHWHQRDSIRRKFNKELHLEARKIGAQVFSWPEWLIDENGALKDEHMEKPGSVHLALKTTWRMQEEGDL